MPAVYGNCVRIMQSPDAVVITYEMIHDTRIIPLDGRPHLGRNINQYPVSYTHLTLPTILLV